MTINDILAIRPSVPEREESRYGKTKTVKGFSGKNDARSAWAYALDTALRAEGINSAYKNGEKTTGFYLEYYRYKDSCTVGLVFAFDGKSYTVCEFRLRYKVAGQTSSIWSGGHNTYDIKTVELATKWIEGSVDDDLSVIAAALSAKYTTAHTAARKHYTEVATKYASLISTLAECLSSLEDLEWDEHAIVCNEALKRMDPEASWYSTIKIEYDDNFHG